MSISIKTDAWHVKDDNGEYRDTAIFSTTLPQEADQLIADTRQSMNGIAADINTSLAEFDAEKQSIAATIAGLETYGTDPELATTGMPADAKAAGDKIGELKSAISSEGYYLITESDIAQGQWKNDGTEEATTSRLHSKVKYKVMKGMRVLYNSTSTLNINILEYDENNGLLASTNLHSVTEETEYEVKNNGYLAFNWSRTSGSYMSVSLYTTSGATTKIGNTIGDKVAILEDNFPVLLGVEDRGVLDFPIVKNIFNKDDEDCIIGGYIGTSNQYVENANYCETGYIPVKPGDIVCASMWKGLSTASLTFNFYRADKSFIRTNSAPYTVPVSITSGVYYVRMAVNAANFDTLAVGIMQTPGEGTTYNNYDFLMKNGETSLYEMASLVNNHWIGKKWYAYGTSLTSTTAGKYVPYVANFSGLLATNKGIPGGGICADTRVKDAVMNTDDGKLEADLITVEVGANEASATLGDIYDTGDSTFCGCLNQVIRYLQQYTSAQIVIMSSTPHRYMPNDPSTLRYPDYVYPGGYTKFEMNEAIRKVCMVNGVYYIPMGDGIGIGFGRIAYNDLYLVDQIHHTNLGGYNVAQGVWAYLKNIPLWYAVLPN